MKYKQNEGNNHLLGHSANCLLYILNDIQQYCFVVGDTTILQMRQFAVG